MDMLMMMTYAALAIVAFKVFRVPVTKWTVTTTALGGVFLMAWIYIAMAFFHPYTPYAQTYFRTIPISSQAKGKVVEVFVKTNRPVKKGEPLFQVDPVPFQATLNELTARYKLSKRRLQETEQLIKHHAIRVYELERHQSELASLTAQVASAKFDLDSTTVRAPADGHVAQNRVQVGVTAGAFRIGSLMTFVSDEEPFFIAAFKPNAIQNVKVGAEAEVIFTSIPGKTFKAKVVKLWDEIAEGEVFPKGTEMISFSKKLPPGRIPVQVEILDDLSAYYIPSGSAAGVCVYSEHLKFLGELRRIFLHLFSWQNVISFDEAEK